jgi:hypothetical protein
MPEGAGARNAYKSGSIDLQFIRCLRENQVFNVQLQKCPDLECPLNSKSKCM